MDYRWNSPYAHTMAFDMFHEHFTEINSIYWANVPASSTIEKLAMKSKKKPLEFFLVHDEDDRRIASTMKAWKNNYREFLNYNRLNMLMLLSSAFETYLRTVTSLAFESKPGVLIMSKDCVDGAELLSNNYEYGESNNKKYLFKDYVDSICIGDWNNRLQQYENFFDCVPIEVNNNSEKLNEFRNKRNLLAHYIGRLKQDYETPLDLKIIPAERVSHDKLMDYFRLIFETASKIDDHLHKEYIGSYDVIKYYNGCVRNDLFVSNVKGSKIKEFQKLLGRAGKQPVGTDYYKWLVNYVDGLMQYDD